VNRFTRPDSAAARARGLRHLIGPLLVASVIIVPATWWLPLFTARVPFLWRHDVSIASGLVELWRLDLLLFSAVLLFSVLVPLAKGAALIWVWYRIPYRGVKQAFHRLALLGKLAMAEVFLLAVMLVGLKGVGIGTVEVTWGLPAFTAAVLLSLASSTWAMAAIPPPFDPGTGTP
jgi:paraquat-inducible protein A